MNDKAKMRSIGREKKDMKKSLVIGLALVLLMSLVAFAAHASDAYDITYATIAFESANLEFEDAEISGLKNMNIDFGTNVFPLGKVNYYAVDDDGDHKGSHTLRVADPNSPAHEWIVTVELSEFRSTSNASNTFFGDIELTNPTPTISNNMGKENDLWFETHLVILGTIPGPREVMSTAGGNFVAGWFDLTWPQSNIKLTIDEANALEITDAEYSAELTWTLTRD